MIKIIPTMILTNDKKIIFPNQLSLEEKFKVLNSGKNNYNINNRPLLKKYLENSIRIAKMSRNGFSLSEFKFISKLGKERNLTILPNIKDFIPNKAGISYVYLSKKNVLEDFLRERKILTAFKNLDDIKKGTRLNKMQGTFIEVPIKPKILLTPNIKDFDNTYIHEGVILISKKYADECNKIWKNEWNSLSNEEKEIQKRPYEIINGSKSAFILKSLILISNNIKDYDILIPESENKLKLSKSQIENNFAINPDINAKTTYSKLLFANKEKTQKGRLPKASLDIQFLANKIFENKNLEILKDIYNNSIDKKEIVKKLFSYVDKEGKSQYNTIGKMIMNGYSLENPLIKNALNKILVKEIKNAFTKPLNGFYGQVMPMRFIDQFNGKIKTYSNGCLVRFPSNLLVKCEIKVRNSMLFVDEILWTKVFNGDSDGDLGYYFLDSRLKPLYDWNNEEDVKELLKLSQFDKKHNEDSKKIKITIFESQFKSKEDQKNIGKTYTPIKYVMSAYTYAGLDMKSINKLDAYLSSTLVQARIDSLKYDVEKQDELTVSDIIKYCEEIKDKLGISYLPEISNQMIQKAIKYYNGCKYSYNLQKMIKIAKTADINSPNPYERKISQLNDWNLK